MEKPPRPATADQVEAQPDDAADDGGAASWNEALNKELQEGFTSADRADMQRLGKKQQFRRNFRLMSTIGFTTCVMGTWEILLTSHTQGLTAGGLPGLFWSLCWAYTGQFFIVLSLAEMASMAPTAGGQYHWVSEFAPRQHQKLLSYLSGIVTPTHNLAHLPRPRANPSLKLTKSITPAFFLGWLSAVSWQSIVALDAFLIGSIIQGLVALNSAAYTPSRWQGTLLVMASVLCVSLFNVFGAKHLPLAEGFFVCVHLFAFFPVIVTLLVLAPKQAAADVFTGFTDNGAGWPSIALTVMVGQVSTMFVVLGSDSVAHMSEEIEDAGVIVPQAMVGAFLLNVPFAFGLLLTYLFSIGDVHEALNDRTGFPFMYVFRKVTGSVRGATGLTIVVLVLLIMVTISSLASTSRQTFAFARDNGLPFSKWLGAVHPTWHVPVNAVTFTCIFSMILSLINIGSTVAFNAMLSLSTVALMATYVICLSCVAFRRLRGEPLPHARWSLGKWGLPINMVALVYASWSFFWSFWPNSYHLTAENFNWACILFVGLMGLSVLLYYTRARHVYHGPVVLVQQGLRD